MDVLLEAQPVQLREERKRSGRPCIGGRSDLWDKLTQVFLKDGQTRTKNGLPGVPYAVKNTIAALRSVWSDNVPDVSAGDAPVDLHWLSTHADAIIASLTTDAYTDSTVSSFALLSLAGAVSALRERDTDTHVTEKVAPRVLYTQELQARYKAAAHAGVPRHLYPTTSTLRHFVSFPDVRRLGQFTGALLDGTVTPELSRLLHWGLFVFSLLLPIDGSDTPIDMALSAVPVWIDALRAWKIDTPPPCDTLVPYLSLHKTTREARIHLSGSTTVLNDKLYDLAEWVMQQKEGLKHMERILPRRLTADGILRRMSQGPLKPSLQGKLLTVRGIRSAWTTYALHDVLQLLDTRIEALQLQAIDPLTLFSTALFPRTVEHVAPVFIPGDAVAAASLVVGAPPARSSESSEGPLA